MVYYTSYLGNLAATRVKCQAVIKVLLQFFRQGQDSRVGHTSGTYRFGWPDYWITYGTIKNATETLYRYTLIVLWSHDT